MVIIHWQNSNPAVLLKKFAGEEGENVDMQKLFGYIGLFTLVSLWWLGKSRLCVCVFWVLTNFSITLSTYNVLLIQISTMQK